MIVNELAKKVGITPNIVRYYVRIGLLKPKRDHSNGYKQFSCKDIQRLGFIRHAQRFGFTLSEIATVLDQNELDGGKCCQTMYAMLRHRVDEHRCRLDKMITLQQRMEAALARWEKAGAAGCAGSPVCPKINPVECLHKS